MKKLSCSLLTFVTLLILFILICFLSIKWKIHKYETDISQKWAELYTCSTEKAHYIQSFTVGINNPNDTEKNILYTVNKNLKNRVYYKNKCSLYFLELEHKLNEETINLLDYSNLNGAKMQSFKEILIPTNNKLNNLIDTYNSSVLHYNKYIAMCPNCLVAKNNGYKMKLLFTIQYGVRNEDPIAKSNEQADWFIGEDSRRNK